VVAANFLAVAARMSLVTFLGIYFVRHAGIDIAVVGAAFLCEHGLRGVLAPLFGALSDRIGRRWLLIGAALATAAVLPCFLLVTGPAMLFAWSIAMGVAGAVNIPVSNALLLDLAPPEKRQSVLALNYTLMSVAYTLAVSPAGYIAEKGYGLLAASSALGYALVAGLYALALRKPLPLEKANSAVFLNTISAFRDPRFLVFAAMAFVFPLSMGMVVAVSPVWAAEGGLGEGYIGLVLGGNSLIVAALAIPAASRMEALGPFRMLPAAAALVSVSLLSYALVPDAAAALLIGTVVFSFGEVIFSSAVPAAVAGLAPAGRRGAYQGGWALVGSLCMGSALVLSGWANAGVGWQVTWLAYALVVLVAAAALWAAARRGFLRQ
jgi:MFS family permease